MKDETPKCHFTFMETHFSDYEGWYECKHCEKYIQQMGQDRYDRLVKELDQALDKIKGLTNE